MPHPGFDLTGQRALVTGSTRGIGFAIARALGLAGAEVALNGRSAGTVAATAEALGREGIATLPAPFDVTDTDAARAVIDRLGPIDILVNNAGQQHRAPAVSFPDEAWNAIIETHLNAAFRLIKLVAPGMIERGRGRIITIASVLSELGRANIPAYGAAKGGLRSLTRCLSTEWAKHGVTVNAIGPGYVLTEMNRPLVEDAAFNAWVCARTPAGRWADPEEIAGAAVFLASPAASYVSGQILYVDGGFTAAM
ncbi:SDR family oxidoreductase [Elioraea tepidiphila]|jgi:gluconate 5-dehydrogenase|uniref:SDR family oxidoreductase n=1 Tax=Elioraea tepidiphila TaxID=457934 RepID=UPI000362500A|nr:SDR family oxidoreductase [Elioraea tepidiphila]